MLEHHFYLTSFGSTVATTISYSVTSAFLLYHQSFTAVSDGIPGTSFGAPPASFKVDGISSSSTLNRSPLPLETDFESAWSPRQADVPFVSAYRPLPSAAVDALPCSDVDIPDVSDTSQGSPSSTILDPHPPSTSADSIPYSFHFNNQSTSPPS